jgi:hypothetical protein
MPGARCRFALGWGDDDPVAMGPIFFARSSRWVGAKFGLFASATLPDIPSGKATIHRFRVT